MNRETIWRTPLTEAQQKALALDRHWAVRAGAGTGKTCTLVRRYLLLLQEQCAASRAQGQPARAAGALSRLLAVTFSNKAAGEMKERLSRAIAERFALAACQAWPFSPGESAFWRDLELSFHEARITTIHAFASRLVGEHADLLGLGAAVSGILEEGEAAALFDRALAEYLDAQLRGAGSPARPSRLGDGEPRRRPLRVLSRLYTREQIEETLRALAHRRQAARAWLARGRGEGGFRGAIQRRFGLSEKLLQQAAACPRLRQALSAFAALPSRAVKDKVQEIHEKLVFLYRALTDAALDGEDRLDFARQALSCAGRSGNIVKKTDARPVRGQELGPQASWAEVCPGRTRKEREEEARRLKREWDAASAALEPLIEAVRCELDDPYAEACLMATGELFEGVLERYRQAKGSRLDFEDCLSYAAELLRDRRRAENLGAEISHLLVDEVQDTNPLQWEILLPLVWNTGGGPWPVPHDPTSTFLGLLQQFIAAPKGAPSPFDPRKRLFVVGDEKQSIYRFRGAEVTVFRVIREAIRAAQQDDPALPAQVPGLEGQGRPLALQEAPEAPERAGILSLEENFRSLPELLELFNALFSRLFPAPGRAGADYEAEFQRLLPRRRSEANKRPGFELLLVAPTSATEAAPIGGETAAEKPEEAGEEDEETEKESALELALREADLLARRLREWQEEGLCEYDEVAVLLRSRLRLKLYEEALRHHGIPFFTFGGVGFWERQEVLDGVHLLAALADPGDDLALCGALRSPAFALSDRALWGLCFRRPGAASLWDRVRAEAIARGWSTAGGSDGESAPPLHGDPYPGAAEAGLAAQAKECAQACLQNPVDVDRLRRAYHLLAQGQAAAWRQPAAEVLRAMLDQTGYFGVLGAGERGRQAVANLDKLLAIINHLETGRRLHLGHLLAVLQARLETARQRRMRSSETEPEAALAPAEEKGLGVRFYTIHAAKGLDFPAVVVPALEARGRRQSPPLAMADLDGELWLGPQKLSADTFSPEDLPLRQWLNEQERRREQAELKRLFYVALTRAQKRVLLSGQFRPTARLVPQGETPSAETLLSHRAWLHWLPALIPPPEERPLEEGATFGDYFAAFGLDDQGGELHGRLALATGALRWEPAAPVSGKTAPHEPPHPRGLSALRDRWIIQGPPLPPAGTTPPVLTTDRPVGGPVKTPQVYTPTMLAGAATGNRAAFLERYGGKNGEEPLSWSEEQHFGGGTPIVPGLPGETYGALFHRAMALVAPGETAPDTLFERLLQEFRADLAEEINREILRRELEGDVARALALPGVAAALADRRSRREVPFAVPLGDGLLRGVMDLLYLDGGQPAIFDYKTDNLRAGEVEAAIAARGYRVQMAAYVLGAGEVWRASGWRAPRRIAARLAFVRAGAVHKLQFTRKDAQRLVEEHAARAASWLAEVTGD